MRPSHYHMWIYCHPRKTNEILTFALIIEEAITWSNALYFEIFDQKLEAGEVLFQNEGSQNVHDRPFPNHRDRKGNNQVMMISAVMKK